MIRTPYRTPRKIIRQQTVRPSTSNSNSKNGNIAGEVNNSNQSLRRISRTIRFVEYPSLSPQPKVIANQPRTLNYYVLQQKRTILLYIAALFLILLISTTATTTPTTTIQKIAYVTAFAIPLTIKRSFELIIDATMSSTSSSSMRRGGCQQQQQQRRRNSRSSSSSSVLQLSPYEEYMNSRRNADQSQQQVQQQQQQKQVQVPYNSYPSTTTSTIDSTDRATNYNYYNINESAMYQNNQNSNHNNHNSNVNMFQEVRYNSDVVRESSQQMGYETSPSIATTSPSSMNNNNNNGGMYRNTENHNDAKYTTSTTSDVSTSSHESMYSQHQSSSFSSTLPQSSEIHTSMSNPNNNYNPNSNYNSNNSNNYLYNIDNNNNRPTVMSESSNAPSISPGSSTQSMTDSYTGNVPPPSNLYNNYSTMPIPVPEIATATTSVSSSSSPSSWSTTISDVGGGGPQSSFPESNLDTAVSATSSIPLSSLSSSSWSSSCSNHQKSESVILDNNEQQQQRQHTSTMNVYSSYDPPTSNLDNNYNTDTAASTSSDLPLSSLSSSSWSSGFSNYPAPESVQLDNNGQHQMHSSNMDYAGNVPLSSNLDNNYNTMSTPVTTAAMSSYSTIESDVSGGFPPSGIPESNHNTAASTTSNLPLSSFSSSSWSSSVLKYQASESVKLDNGEQKQYTSAMDLQSIGFSANRAEASIEERSSESIQATEPISAESNNPNHQYSSSNYNVSPHLPDTPPTISTDPMLSSSLLHSDDKNWNIEHTAVNANSLVSSSNEMPSDDDTVSYQNQQSSHLEHSHIPEQPLVPSTTTPKFVEDNKIDNIPVDTLMAATASAQATEETLQTGPKDDVAVLQWQAKDATLSSSVTSTTLFATTLSCTGETSETIQNRNAQKSDVFNSLPMTNFSNGGLHLFGTSNKESSPSSLRSSTDGTLDREPLKIEKNIIPKTENRDQTSVKQIPIGLFGTKVKPASNGVSPVSGVATVRNASFGQPVISSKSNSQPLYTIAELSAKSLIDTCGMTERIMNQIDDSRAKSVVGQSNTYAAFKKLENEWTKVKTLAKYASNVPTKSRPSFMSSLPAMPFVTSDAVFGNPKCWAKLREHAVERKLDYDIVILGGSYGIFLALSLIIQNPHHRICVVESGHTTNGFAKEWHVSPAELNELVAMSILTDNDVQEITLTENPAGRFGYQDNEVSHLKGELFDRLVGFDSASETTVGVSSTILSELVKLKFLQSGGLINDNSILQGVTISDSVGAALDFGETHEPITTQLLIDCQGGTSPISNQRCYSRGTNPDGVCVVVGSHASGYDPLSEVQSDIIVTADTSHETFSEGLLQYFSEAPLADPIKTCTKTIYMLSYFDAEQDRPSLESLMEDYWRMLPKFQPGIKSPEDDLTIQQILCSFFPTYSDSPFAMQFNRILDLNDSSGTQTPLSLVTLGTTCRNLRWMTKGIVEIFAKGEFQKERLDQIYSFAPGLSSAWMFQKGMATKTEQKVDKIFVNRILTVSTKTRLNTKEARLEKQPVKSNIYDSSATAQSMRDGFSQYVEQVREIKQKADLINTSTHETETDNVSLSPGSSDPKDGITENSDCGASDGSAESNESISFDSSLNIDTPLESPRTTSSTTTTVLQTTAIDSSPDSNYELLSSSSQGGTMPPIDEVVTSFPNNNSWNSIEDVSDVATAYDDNSSRLQRPGKDNQDDTSETTNGDQRIEKSLSSDQQALFGSSFVPEFIGKDPLVSVPLSEDIQNDNPQQEALSMFGANSNFDQHQETKLDTESTAQSAKHDPDSKCTSDDKLDLVNQIESKNNVHGDVEMSRDVMQDITQHQDNGYRINNSLSSDVVPLNGLGSQVNEISVKPTSDTVVFESGDPVRDASQPTIQTTASSQVSTFAGDIDSENRKIRESLFSQTGENEIYTRNGQSTLQRSDVAYLNAHSTQNSFTHQAISQEFPERVPINTGYGNSNGDHLHTNIHSGNQASKYHDTMTRRSIASEFSLSNTQLGGLFAESTKYNIDAEPVRQIVTNGVETSTGMLTNENTGTSFDARSPLPATGKVSNVDPVVSMVNPYQKALTMPLGSSYENLHAQDGRQKYQSAQMTDNNYLSDTNNESQFIAVDRSSYQNNPFVSSHGSHSVQSPRSAYPSTPPDQNNQIQQIPHESNVLHKLQSGTTYENVREYQTQSRHVQHQHSAQPQPQDQYSDADTNSEFIPVKRTQYQRYNTNNGIPQLPDPQSNVQRHGYATTSVLEPPPMKIQTPTSQDTNIQQQQYQQVPTNQAQPHQYSVGVLERPQPEQDDRFAQQQQQQRYPEQQQQQQQQQYRHESQQQQQQQQFYSAQPPSPLPPPPRPPDDGFDRFRLVARGTTVPIVPDKGMMGTASGGSSYYMGRF